MRKLIKVVILSLLLVSFAAAALADVPYASYSYDEWDRSVSAPVGYTVEKTVYGAMTSSGAWKEAQDLITTADGRILVADTGNNRILEYDASFNLLRTITEFQRNGQPMAVTGPTGLHVDADGKLYVAMSSAAQAVIADLQTLETTLVIENLEHALLGSDFKFVPAKIGADNAGRIYILSTGCFSGLLQFSPQGEFMGYYGSNKVAVTAEVIFQYYWKSIMTDEQRANMTSILPVEYSNLHCAPDGFVYASTVGTETPVNQIKRLNPLGNNTYFARGGKEVNFGDEELASVKNVSTMVTLLPTFVDVVTTEDCEFIYAVDRAYGRIFERDRNGNLISVFGALGNQEGTFKQPSAIALLNGDVLVLDTGKSSVTVFEPSEYAALVHEAVQQYNAGEYAASRDVWLEVLRRNTNATQAYAGVGRALLKENRYDEALEYFKLGDSREEYSQAYRIVRLNVIRDNAPWVVCAVVVAVILFKLLGLLLRKLGRKKGMIADFGGRLLDKVHLSRNTVFPKVLFHPFDGFNQIRFGGSVALWPSVIILVLYVIATIYQFVGTGYLFNQNNIADINLWLLLAKSLGVVALFIVAQWSMAILTNGSGRFKDIIVTACYSLAPYTVGLLVGTWLSNFIIMDEMYAEYIILIGLAWSAMLLLIGTMVIHELPFARALGFLALTVAAMAVILFVLVLFYTLLMQLRTFGYTLYVELVFRM
jgi:tetratricopeptide (TPR) repeat protein